MKINNETKIGVLAVVGIALLVLGLSFLKGKNLFMPIRVAVIGKPQGTELKILVPLMKKSSLIERADKALEMT